MTSLTAERFTHLPQHPAHTDTEALIRQIVALLAQAIQDDRRSRNLR